MTRLRSALLVSTEIVLYIAGGRTPHCLHKGYQLSTKMRGQCPLAITSGTFTRQGPQMSVEISRN